MIDVCKNGLGEPIIVCRNAIPDRAMAHLRMLNETNEPDAALEKFEIYFNEKLLTKSFYWDDEKDTFRVNEFEWVPKPHFKLRTPKIVVRTNHV